MILRSKVSLAVLICGLAATATWLIVDPSEPRCDGKKLHVWWDEIIAACTSSPDQCPEAKLRTADAIRRTGPPALPFLLAKLHPPRSKFLATINRWLFRIPHFDFQLRLPTDYSDFAVEGFRALGPAARSAIPTLEKLLADPEDSWMAARALAMIGPDSMPALQRALHCTDERLILSALGGIEGAGPNRTAQALPDLVAALTNASPRVRDLAAGVVGAYGDSARPAIPLLTQLLQDTNCVRGAAYAMARIDPEPLVLLLAATTNRDRVAKTAAYGALLWRATVSKITSLDQDCDQPALRSLFNSKAMSAQWFLYATNESGLALKALEPYLNDTNAAVRAEAARRLQALGLPVIPPPSSGPTGKNL